MGFSKPLFSWFFLAASPLNLAAEESVESETPPAIEVPSQVTELIQFLRSNDVLIPDWPETFAFSTTYNAESPVPPMCYTRHEAKFNPCYVCHQDPKRFFENLQSDFGLQAAYDFSDQGFANHWLNLFEDRSDRVAKISDHEILDYIREDNYSELSKRLRSRNFEGWIPDLKDLELAGDAFDDDGFAKDGSGWVAFNYKPMPSTFWPANGATDDVMIRLPERFRTLRGGGYSRDVYAANLALLELGIKRYDSIGSLPVNEEIVEVDLDGDGELGVATTVLRRSHFVGAADKHEVFDTMYPKGTEFLHTVRYIDVNGQGEVCHSKRMKEVRYMVRNQERRRIQAADHYREEQLDKEAGKLPSARPFVAERALESETGWLISGFIEGHGGRLRANTFEETFACMGCHNSVGSTIDKTFSFPRKIDGARGWGYINLKGMPDAPNVGETRGEIATYLDRVGGGSEFRHNGEMVERWFTPEGQLDFGAVAAAKDVYELITPSVEKAMELNKAYKVIVEDQDFVFGKDPTILPPKNVIKLVDPDDSPTLPAEKQFRWDIRLDWNLGFKQRTRTQTQSRESAAVILE